MMEVATHFTYSAGASLLSPAAARLARNPSANPPTARIGISFLTPMARITWRPAATSIGSASTVWAADFAVFAACSARASICVLARHIAAGRDQGNDEEDRGAGQAGLHRTVFLQHEHEGRSA